MTSPAPEHDDGRPARPSEHTTERVWLDDYGDSTGDHVIYSLHVATYQFAIPYVSGRDVLDFGCGSGYGTAMLAEEARSAIGVDLDDDAINYAAAHFRKDNLTFEQIQPVEVSPLGFPDESFDVAVSFQVIEHVPDVQLYLREVHRVLRPGGTLLCVTPDRRYRLFTGQRPWNEFHVTEFTPEQVAAALGSRFVDVQMLGMTAAPEIIDHELRRYRRMRTLAYPFTFPGAPEAWRRFGIRTAKRFMGRKHSSTESEPGRVAEPYSFGPADIVIDTEARPSVNVVAIAHRGPGQAT